MLDTVNQNDALKVRRNIFARTFSSSMLLITALSTCVLSACDSRTDTLAQELASMRGDLRDLRQMRHQLASLEKDVTDIRALIAQSERRESPVYPSLLKTDGSHLDDPFFGRQDAALVMFAFIDFQSKSCRQFAQNVLPRLKSDFAENGGLKIVLRDFPLESHTQATKAAILAHCAGEQGAYFRAHDLLFDHQANVETGDFTALKVQIETVDRERLERCISSTKYDKEIRADIEEGRRLGIQGVPSFFIGKAESENTLRGVFIRGAQPFAIFQKEIANLTTSNIQPNITPSKEPDQPAESATNPL